ncbi:MAG: hypothetical protein R3F59_33960 [Myxococcota bacterium]
MRAMVLTLLVACASDSKVQDNIDPDGVQGGDATATATGTTPTGDETDTTPGDDDDDDNVTDTATTGTGTSVLPPDATGDEICTAAAALASVLDPYQIPDDGRVFFCHGGGGTNLHYIETDISSCLPHIDHPSDVFPTTGCDS